MGNSLAQWLPDEATLSFEPDPADGQMHWIAALNFHAYVRPMRAVFERTLKGKPGVTTERHGDHTILRLDGGRALALCFADGTLLVSDRVELLRSVLDRFSQPASLAVPAPPETPALPGEWDSWGAMTAAASARMLVTGLLAAGGYTPEEQPPQVEQLVGARFGLDVVSADEMKALLHLFYASEAAASEAAPIVQTSLDEIGRRAEANGFQLRSSQRGDGPRLEVELQLGGLTEAMERRLRKGEAEPTREREGGSGSPHP